MATFSSRLPGVLEKNRLARALERQRATGASFVDLTETNPTRVGLRYPDRLLEPLGSARAGRYDPSPLGLPSARRAVASFLRQAGVSVDPERTVLTASTSDAYATLFKLLCDPGDEVMVPTPSYPLVEHLVRLEGLVARSYQLDFHGRWEVDLAGLEAAITPRTRAVVVVSPNNPTGSVCRPSEYARIVDTCRHRGLALIVDEVFAPYPLDLAAARPTVLATPSEVLTFVLGGLSKAVGLPQLKLGWIVATGPADLVTEALARLEVITDTYLSVASPVQLAAAELLARGAEVTRQVIDRVRANYQCLGRIVESTRTVTRLPSEGGWYAVIQVLRTRSEEAIVLELLEHERVLVHPGYFFDFPREAFLVLSLLPPPELFEPAVERVVARVVSGAPTS